MTLQQLRYAVTVAETANITEAANQLFISQPSLTNAIHELEREMQITIFNRSNKGVTTTNEGDMFLSYARQILEQTQLMEEKFLQKKVRGIRFSVSCQHYSFAVNAFVDLIREFGGDEYDYILRETKTYDIIEDVSNMRSEIGVLFLSSKNEEALTKLFRKNGLEFTELIVARPHVFLPNGHPLAGKKLLQLSDLEEYPYLSFEQGGSNAFYFAEEVLNTLDRKKNIKVSDRATLSNLMTGLNGYTVATGIISKELNGANILSIPLAVDEYMRVIAITRKGHRLSRYGTAYMEYLKRHCSLAKG